MLPCTVDSSFPTIFLKTWTCAVIISFKKQRVKTEIHEKECFWLGECVEVDSGLVE